MSWGMRTKGLPVLRLRCCGIGHGGISVFQIGSQRGTVAALGIAPMRSGAIPAVTARDNTVRVQETPRHH